MQQRNSEGNDSHVSNSTEIPTPLDIPTVDVRLSGLQWPSPRDDAQPAIALHGWLDNAQSFANLAPLVPSLHWLAPDLSGHGHSPHRARPNAYHFIDWVPEVYQIANALNLDKFTLVGHSMGAAIASLVAGSFPERIRCLVLIEALGPFSAVPEYVPQRTRDYSMQRHTLEDGRKVYPHKQAMISRLTAAMPGLTEASAHLLIERNIQEVATGYTWRSDPALRATSPMPLSEAHVQAFLRKITAPTLLIAAENGLKFDRDLFAARAQCIPHMQIATLQGDHHVHMSNAARVAECIRDFVVNVT